MAQREDTMSKSSLCLAPYLAVAAAWRKGDVTAVGSAVVGQSLQLRAVPCHTTRSKLRAGTWGAGRAVTQHALPLDWRRRR